MPADIAFTRPVDEPTVATPGRLLLQVPPPPSISAEVLPVQIAVLPDIAAGSGLTVNVAACAHPVVLRV